jgi:hypothetical protein
VRTWLQGFLFVALIGLALCTNGEVAAAETPACVTLGPVDIGKLHIDRCQVLPEPNAQDPLGDLPNYYGQVFLTANETGEVSVDSKTAAFFEALIGAKKQFSVVVALSIFQTVQGQSVKVYEKPLFSIDRGNDGKSTITTHFMAGNNVPATLPIALSSNNSSLYSTLSILIVDTTQVNAVTTVSKGFDAVSALGGPTMLVTALSEPKLLALLNTAQSAYSSAISSQQQTGVDQYLDFTAGSGAKEVHYTISVPNSHKGTIQVTANLTLTKSPSLITALKLPNGWPDYMKSGFIGQFGQRISVNGADTLTSALAKTAVSKLTLLSPGGTGVQPVAAAGATSQLDTLNQQCESLKTALAGPDSTFRLSGPDYDAVLYDIVNNAGVFNQYSADQLTCLRTSISRFQDRYGFPIATPPPPKPKPRNVPQALKTARLTHLATDWDYATPSDRTHRLSDDVTATVQLSAPSDLFPDAPVPADNGIVSYTASALELAKLRKSCFGNFKPTADDAGWSTAFAQFAGHAQTYLVKVSYDNVNDWDPALGPRINKVEITVPTSTDVQTYKLNGNCF